MASGHQQPRGRSGRQSTEPYNDATPQSHYADPPSAVAGTKRLFSNRQSKVSSSAQDHGEDDNGDDQEGSTAVHSEKRHRSSDWPLLNNPSPAYSSTTRASSRAYRNSTSSPRSSHNTSQQRPSKFVEGSMNDRVSQKPPMPYIGTDEELQERYDQEQRDYNRGRKGRPLTYPSHSNTSIPETDTSRHSSIFRFGKSLAASFNPSNWKIFNKPVAEEYDDEEAKRLRVLKERQDKAEKIYKELKESGHFRDSAIPTQNYESFTDKKAGKYDSGVSFTNGRSSTELETSREEKRMGRVFLEAPASQQGSKSPASNVGSRAASATPSRSLFNLKNASLSSIKKPFNHDNDLSNGDHQARRIPSRKDLQKQQKLVKRVSDLEGKLEAARKQLNDALGEPLPPVPPKATRARFAPMPTLPSERLLSGYLPDQAEDGEIGKAVSFDQEREMVFSKLLHHSHMAPPSRQAPGLPQEHVIQSVETESRDQWATSASEVSTDAMKDGDYVDEPEGASDDDEGLPSDSDNAPGSEPEESTPRPRASTKITPNSRKRKSANEGFADDGGSFKPTPESASELDSPIKATSRKTSITQARRLQKTAPSASSPPNRAPPPPPTRGRARAPVLSGTHVPSASTPLKAPPSKAIKTSIDDSPSQQTPRAKAQKIPRKAVSVTSSTTASSRPQTRGKARQLNPNPNPDTRQSVSPPPSSDKFTGPGISYPKPTSQKQQHIGPQIGDAGEGGDTREEKENSIPPMPKLPRQVRLPSGEVIAVKPRPIRSQATTATTKSGAKLQKKRAVKGDDDEEEGEDMAKKNGKGKLSKSQTTASFEWPEDVF